MWRHMKPILLQVIPLATAMLVSTPPYYCMGNTTKCPRKLSFHCGTPVQFIWFRAFLSFLSWTPCDISLWRWLLEKVTLSCRTAIYCACDALLSLGLETDFGRFNWFKFCYYDWKLKFKDKIYVNCYTFVPDIY